MAVKGLKRGYPCCLITTFCCLVGLAAVCATVFHDGAMNPIEGFLSHFDFVPITIIAFKVLNICVLILCFPVMKVIMSGSKLCFKWQLTCEKRSPKKKKNKAKKTI